MIFDGRRAVGVRYRRRRRSARRRAPPARSCSPPAAIGTPHLLELSGVGRPEVVSALGGQLVHALPGVGENLQDHLQLRTIFRIAGARTLNVDYSLAAASASAWRSTTRCGGAGR